MIFLNWRIWAFAALVGAIAMAGYTGFKEGEKTVQALFDAYRLAQDQQALAAEQAARAKEQSLNLANQKVSQDYEDLKKVSAAAISRLDGERVRLQAAIAAVDHPASKDTPAVAVADESPEGRVLSDCVRQYDSVATDADRLSDQVKGLQKYIQDVASSSE